MTDEIKCGHCLQKGKIPLPFETRKLKDRNVFEYIGYDLTKGYLYFRCPVCSSNLAVSPLHMLDSGIAVGFPVRWSEEKNEKLVKTPLLYLLRALAHPSL